MGLLQERFGVLLPRLKEYVRDAKTPHTLEGRVDAGKRWRNRV